jgi:hypothetical protein
MRTVALDVRARTPVALDDWVEPERIVSCVSATMSHDPASVCVYTFYCETPFFQQSHGFVGYGFAGHNERHYVRISVVVVFFSTIVG